MENFLIYTNDYYIDCNGNKKEAMKKLPQMVKENCLRYGSSYEGRREGFSYYCGKCYKNPVILDDKGEKAFFLTRSLYAKDCVVINNENLQKFHNKHNEETTLIFHNDITIYLTINYRIIRRQLRLLKQYRQKWKEKDIIQTNG